MSDTTQNLHEGFDDEGQPIITNEDLDNELQGVDNDDEGDAGTTEPVE